MVLVGCAPSEVEVALPKDLPINDAELVVVNAVIGLREPSDIAWHVLPMAFLKPPVVLVLLKDKHHDQAFSVRLQELVG